MKENREVKLKLKSIKPSKPRLKFDRETEKIIYGDKSCKIPFGTYQYYVCSIVFNKKIGVRVPEGNILEAIDPVNQLEGSPRAISDVCRAINKKVEGDIGIPKLLEYRAAHIWINIKYK